MNNSKVTAASIALYVRAEARAERQSRPTLFGQAGIKKAIEAKRCMIAGAKGSNDEGRIARIGREKLLKAAFQGVVPSNAITTKNIEEAARAAGWVRAARENRAAHAALYMLKGMYPAPQAGANSVCNIGELGWVLKKWASPLSVTQNAARATIWLIKHFPVQQVQRCTPRFLDLLGRLKPQTRWAAVEGVLVTQNAARATIWLIKHFPVQQVQYCDGDGYNVTPVVTHREINWEAVAIAQKGLRAASAYWPKITHRMNLFNMEWAYALGVKPIEAAITNKLRPNSVSDKLFKEILEFSTGTAKQTEMVDSAYRLALMFRSLDSVKQWVIKTQGGLGEMETLRDWPNVRPTRTRKLCVHDAGQLLPLFKSHPGWESLLLRAPAQMAPVIKCIPTIQEHLKGKAPKTVPEALDLVVELGLENEMYNLTSREVAFIQSTPVKAWEELPAVTVTEGKYTLKKVPFSSPLNLIAGRLVNCCQHLESAGASCARQAYSQPEAGIYAVFTPDGTMVAQTFAWRSKSGNSLVFDSVEALRGHKVEGLFFTAAKMITGKLGIARVCCGLSGYGITGDLVAMGEPKTVKAPDCAFRLGYSDVGGQVAVIARSQKERVKLVKTQKVDIKTKSTNELQEGSGVECEHCGAEVHPDTEICPSCGGNIAEWVE